MNEIEKIAENQLEHLKQFQEVVRAVRSNQKNILNIYKSQKRLVYCIAFYFSCKALLYFLF